MQVVWLPHSEKKMVEKRVITRMDITGTEDNTEKYQSLKAAQRWTSKLEGKRRKQKLREMMNAEAGKGMRLIHKGPSSAASFFSWEQEQKSHWISPLVCMTSDGQKRWPGYHLGAMVWSPCRATQRSYWEPKWTTRSQGRSTLVPSGSCRRIRLDCLTNITVWQKTKPATQRLAWSSW